MSMTELEAARLVRAGLRLLGDAVPELTAARDVIGRAIAALDEEIPPWQDEPEPGPSAERKWSEVIPEDKVLAPNGTWYPVESVVRIGDKVRALLKTATGSVVTERRAGDMVKVERGDAGRAVDVFAAGGISLEQIGAGQ